MSTAVTFPHLVHPTAAAFTIPRQYGDLGRFLPFLEQFLDSVRRKHGDYTPEVLQIIDDFIREALGELEEELLTKTTWPASVPAHNNVPRGRPTAAFEPPLRVTTDGTGCVDLTAGSPATDAASAEVTTENATRTRPAAADTPGTAMQVLYSAIETVESNELARSGTDEWAGQRRAADTRTARIIPSTHEIPAGSDAASATKRDAPSQQSDFGSPLTLETAQAALHGTRAPPDPPPLRTDDDEQHRDGSQPVRKRRRVERPEDEQSCGHLIMRGGAGYPSSATHRVPPQRSGQTQRFGKFGDIGVEEERDRRTGREEAPGEDGTTETATEEDGDGEEETDLLRSSSEASSIAEAPDHTLVGRDEDIHPRNPGGRAQTSLTLAQRRLYPGLDVDDLAETLAHADGHADAEELSSSIESLTRLIYLFGRIFGEDGRDNLRELLQYLPHHTRVRAATPAHAVLAAADADPDDDVARMVGAYRRQAASGASVLVDTCERSIMQAEFSRLFDDLVLAYKCRDPRAKRILDTIRANATAVNGKRAQTVVTDYVLFETQRIPLHATANNTAKWVARKKLHGDLSLGRLYARLERVFGIGIFVFLPITRVAL